MVKSVRSFAKKLAARGDSICLDFEELADNIEWGIEHGHQ